MSEQLTFFPLPQTNENNSLNFNQGKPKLKHAIRNQIEIKTGSLDDLLPKIHLARDVWRYVEGLNLNIALQKIQSIEGDVGRSAIDPKILLALWLYAVLEGIGSARLLAEYCTMHDAFKWICGGININYHTLSDFRSLNVELFDGLLTESVAILAHNNLISLEAVSQDGMRVRAYAGSSSFRRKASLKFSLDLAQMLVADLMEEARKNPGACRTRMQAAQERAAKETENKLKNAIKELNETRKSKIRSGKKELREVKEEELEKTRASTTDPDARVMKMAGGGFRPAYNVQFATTNKGKAIIGVDVTKSGSDQKQTIGMIEQVEKRYNQIPKKWLQDAGFKNQSEMEKIVKRYKTCEIYMPVKEAKNENDAMRELRERMETDEAKTTYKERAATAEYVNALARNRGMQQFCVRGLSKVKNVALMFALAHNMYLALVVI
ncbi:MAG: transposase [Candidatus Rhabdochlamydia sp.]